MKKIISCVIVISFFLFENCNRPSAEKPSMQDTHLGELMGHMQYEFIKLGLALQHHNQALANFYMHEVNEAYDDIVSKNVMDGPVNISQKITQIFPSK